MKFMSLFAALTLSLAASVVRAEAANDLLEGEVEGIAQIIDVKDNQMFPVRTITLTAVISCGTRILGGYSQDLGQDNVEVGVKIAYNPAAMACLAMPTEHDVEVEVLAERPVNIIVNGLAIPL